MFPYFLVSLALVGRVLAQGNWTTTPFNPPSLAFAAKSPYVNVWAPLGFETNASAATYNAWPRLGDPSYGIIGWYAAIRVDGKPYNLLGDFTPVNSTDAVQQALYFTATRSSFLLQAGTVNVNMTFMSPVEPTDLMRQSMPFSYLYFTVESNDGNAHDVQIYSDISSEWIGGDNALGANWTINESSNFVYLQTGLSSPAPYQELNNRPMDGTAYYCMMKTDGVTWQIGPADDLRNFFANGTELDKSAESTFHGVGVPYFDTLGIAVKLGSITSTSEPVVYAVGVVRDPVVRYTNGEVQIKERSAYYWSNFTNIHDVIEDVLDHFADALTASTTFDNQIVSAGGQVSGEYVDILSLSTRQSLAALEITLLRENGGQFNTSDVKAFMKDFGKVGSGGVNAVDVLYASMPIYLYLNPNLLGYLLSPLLVYQESTQYTSPYAAQDLGQAFPNATGNPNGHDQKIEHTASMLIMSLAHAQGAGDGNLLAQHYDLLNNWANYLVNSTMNPGDETTSITDDITSTNNTNLMLKGIIGIGAMAKISEYTGHSDDQGRFDSVAKGYIQQWKSLASGADLLALNPGSSTSGLFYNLYADKLLQLNLVDSTVYDLQTTFYSQQTALWKYGIPLDTSASSPISRSDWMMFAASSASDTSVRNSMISQVHEYAAVNRENLPFPIAYYADNGTWTAGFNSPAQGATYAPLALSMPIKSVSFNGASSSSGDSKSSNTGVIVGAAVGAIAGLSAIASLAFFLYRRRRREKLSMDIFNRADRIERVKPATYPSDSVLEPLSATVHPGMYDMRGIPSPSQANLSNTFNAGSSANVAAYPQSGPFHVRNLTESEIAASSDRSSAVGGSSSGAGSTAALSSQRPLPKTRQHQDELRSEVDNLRREIERIREERVVVTEAPPSYDEDIVNAFGGPDHASR